MRHVVPILAVIVGMLFMIAPPWERGAPSRPDAPAADASIAPTPTSLEPLVLIPDSVPATHSVTARVKASSSAPDLSELRHVNRTGDLREQNPYDHGLRQWVDWIVATRDFETLDPRTTPAQALVVHRYTSGCFNSTEDVIRVERNDAMAGPDNACALSEATTERLRDLVCASRPGSGESLAEILRQPDSYLARLGLTREFVAANRELILDHCIRAEWRAASGELAPIPVEVERLLDFDCLKFIVGGGLFTDSGSTLDYMTILEFPGDPWIALGTSGDNPDGMPWYVRVGSESWYTMDRELVRTLLALVPDSARWGVVAPSSQMLLAEGLDRSNLKQAVGKILNQQRYEGLPGYEAASRQFAIMLDHRADRSGAVWWPLTLTSRKPAVIDAIYIRSPGCVGPDWFALLEAYSRAEEIAASYRWLVDWKRAQHGSTVLVAALGWASCDFDVGGMASRAWRESGLDGEPQFQLTGGISNAVFSNIRYARVTFSSSGAIVDDLFAGSPMEQFRSEGDISSKGKYVLIRPGKEPELRTLSSFPGAR